MSLRILLLLVVVVAVSVNAVVVEFLEQNMFCKDVKRFIKDDREIWTVFLKAQNGFISKEYWLDARYENKISGNCTVYQHIVWQSRELWKEVDDEELKVVSETFVQSFGYEPILVALPSNEGFDVLL